MPKRTSITLLSTVVIAIVALFAATEVMAFCDNCDPPVDTLTNGDWKITLVSVLDCATSPNCTGSGLYDWYYEVKKVSTGRSKGLNFLAMLIPDCCNGPKIAVDLVQSSLFKDYFAVAEGEPTVNFGMYNEQTRVAKGTPDNLIDWHLITNTNAKTESTIILKVRKVGVLAFEMAVPGCPLDPNQPLSTESYIQVGTVTLQVLYNAAGESYDVTCEDCTITDIKLSDLKLYKEDDLEEGTVIWLPFDKPIGAEASPGCYYYRTRAGKLKRICP